MSAMAAAASSWLGRGMRIIVINLNQDANLYKPVDRGPSALGLGSEPM